MSVIVYAVSAVLVFVFSGLLAMAGLGAAFLFVPLFYYLGVPLAEATPTALLLNVVSLLFAAITYWRVGLPVLVTAVILSPLGALLTPRVNKSVLLWMFASFLIFAGIMMLFFKARKREKEMGRAVEAGAGVGVGGVAGFLGGLLGVGGGNFIVPVLNWLGLDPKVGLALHGHKCPAMPLGLRAGLAAMEALSVRHAPDGQLTALVEIDRNHCSTCFADGVQVATGCTFGKGNIRSLGYGKFALTLIDNKTSRGVRVVPTPKTIRRNQDSEFLGLRRQGTPASQIDPALSEPLIDAVLADPVEALFSVEPIKQMALPPMLPHAFDTIICAECGEMAVERYARVKHGKIVCMPCAEKIGSER